MTIDGRITDYDRIADRFDARYAHYPYDGVRETLLAFLGPGLSAVLEVGCGTGHWLAIAHAARLPAPSPVEGPVSSPAEALAPSRVEEERSPVPLIGVDPSGPMLDRARVAAPGVLLVRARAEALPWPDASFDRVFCINALHHFGDRAQFFAEARRILKPGGGLLTIGKDPYTEHDQWWVYDYFEETRAIDRARFARVRTLRGEMALAGFAWTESMEADRVEVVRPASEAIANGIVDPSFTSQLTVLSEEEYQRGADRLRQANDAAGGQLQLVADFRLYATIGWL
jgi:ubiquinone/menaquinone biosynthesis C-methylase UbiE